MTIRSIAAGALAALALAACDKQAAGPEVNSCEATTGTVIARVKADTARTPSADTTTFIAQAGVRVNLYRVSDTTLAIRNTSTDTRGRAVFAGLEPGDYILRVVPRSRTALASARQDTVTVVAGAADTTSVGFWVRLGASLGGSVTAQYTTQQRVETRRFPNVEVAFFREILQPVDPALPPPPPVFEAAPFAVDTTDVVGTFSVNVVPGPERYQLQMRALSPITGDVPAADSLFIGGALNAAVSLQALNTGVITMNSSAGILPNASATLNQTFQYPGLISAVPFRDQNGNGVRDSLDRNGDGVLESVEQLVPADSIVLQLRSGEADEAQRRVIVEAARVVGTSANAQPAATFASLQGGTYYVTISLLGSRLGSNPLLLQRSSSVEVVLANSFDRRTGPTAVLVPIPLGP